MKYIIAVLVFMSFIQGSSDFPIGQKIDNLKTDNLKLEGLDEVEYNAVKDWKLGKIRFKAYKTNYLVYSHLNDIPNGNPNDSREFKNGEVKFQFSVRGDVFIDWIDNYDFLLSGAYTQISNWQQFIDSSPFRETNYEPELFFTLPMDELLYLKELKMNNLYLGYKHSSNGLSQVLDENGKMNIGLSQSRSWNRLYVASEWNYENLFLKATYWKRLGEDKWTDDNPDIEDYYGSGELELSYVKNEVVSTLQFRRGWESKGGVGGSITYPLIRKKKLMFYTQWFHGYGYSLIDYDRKLTQVGVGFAISR